MSDGVTVYLGTFRGRKMFTNDQVIAEAFHWMEKRIHDTRKQLERERLVLDELRIRVSRPEVR